MCPPFCLCYCTPRQDVNNQSVVPCAHHSVCVAAPQDVNNQSVVPCAHHSVCVAATQDKMLTIGVSFHVPTILLSVFSWSSFYFGLRHLEPQRKAEWHCRIVTAIHASLISVISGWCTFVQGPWPFTDAGNDQLSPPYMCCVCILFVMYSNNVMIMRLKAQFESFYNLLIALQTVSSTINSRVSNQNGVPLLYIMLKIHHSGREPSTCGQVARVQPGTTHQVLLMCNMPRAMWYEGITQLLSLAELKSRKFTSAETIHR